MLEKQRYITDLYIEFQEIGEKDYYFEDIREEDDFNYQNKEVNIINKQNSGSK